MNVPQNPLHMWKYAGEMALKAVCCKLEGISSGEVSWTADRASLTSFLLHNIILVLWDAYAIIVEKVHGRCRGGGEEVDKLRNFFIKLDRFELSWIAKAGHFNYYH